MPAGSKSYKSVLINGGKLFLLAFCAVTPSVTVSGLVTSNPFEFLIDGCNVGKAGEPMSNSLIKVLAIQHGKQVNRFLPNKTNVDGTTAW